MAPFGYLAYTPLIGRGACNNPFFGLTGGPAAINQTDPNRTAFGNHAFVRLLNYGIGDSCAGPHIGNEYVDQYIASAMDSLYPNPPRVQRGTSANVNYYTGVTHVDFISSITALSATNRLHELKAIIGYAEPKLAPLTERVVIGKWPNPIDTGILTDDYKLFYNETVPGPDEVLKIWMLKNDTEMLTIKVYVASGGKELAHNRFLRIGTLYQTDENPYENGSEDLGDYAVIIKKEGYSRCIQLFNNVMLEITHSSSKAMTLALAEHYYNWAKEHRAEHISRHLPEAALNYRHIDEDHFQITLISDENTFLEFEHTEGYQLTNLEDKLLAFKGPQTSKPLKVLIIDKDTFLVNSKHVS